MDDLTPGTVVCPTSDYERWKLEMATGDRYVTLPSAMTVVSDVLNDRKQVASWSEVENGMVRTLHTIYAFEIRPYPTIRMADETPTAE